MEPVTRSISVFGLGYVGTVTAACFARQSSRVIAVDVNPAKVVALESGLSPVMEARLDELVAEGRRAGRLHATADPVEAVCRSDVSFVCVGTPSQPNGRLDLAHVERVCHEIGRGISDKNSFHSVVLRSTVLPGTTRSLVIPTLESAAGKRAGVDFSVSYNPEFMREGSGVADFLEPPYTVLGADNPEDLTLTRELYRWVPGPVFETTLEVAEMVKYASNAFHALKVCFANEIGTLCSRLGVDAERAMEIFTSDTRLNVSPAYLSPGFAFGGSCLPKDLRALGYRARELDVHVPMLDAILPSNTAHFERALDAVLRSNPKKVGVLGLSFKTGTDDLRESPLVRLVKRLLGEGCQVQIWDECVSLSRVAGSNREFIEKAIPHIGSLLSSNLQQVIATADVVVIGTRSVDKKSLATYLSPTQVVVDLVNLEKARRLDGITSYRGICW